MGAIKLLDYAAQEQDEMRQGLIMKVVSESAFLTELKFVTLTGVTEYEYGEYSKLPAIGFRALNGSYDADAGTVNPKKERTALFGGIVQIDHTKEGTATHTNAVMAKLRAAGLFYDYMVINGDSSLKDPTANVVGAQFDGLKHRLVGDQVIFAGGDGGAVTVDLVDQLLDAVVGPNSAKLLVMSKYQRRKLKGVLRTAASAVTLTDVSAAVETYDGARIIVMDEDDRETPVLPQTETRGASDVTGSIYCIRPGQSAEGEYVQGLVVNIGGAAAGSIISHKPLAQTNTLVGDLIEMFGGLAVFHGRAAARLAGLL